MAMATAIPRAEEPLIHEGSTLVKNWLGAQERLRRAESEVVSAQVDVANSARDLAKWMLPDDAKPGEKIAMWHGDSLIQIEVPQEQSHSIGGGSGGGGGTGSLITVRKRGRALNL